LLHCNSTCHVAHLQYRFSNRSTLATQMIRSRRCSLVPLFAAAFRPALLARFTARAARSTVRRPSQRSWTCASRNDAKPWRPAREDVDRISRGQAARHRGTGSRAVPHRLNADERRLYDIALRKNFLELAGGGNRRERKGSPLANTFRMWCDALAQPSVILHKMPDGRDKIVVDLATLRACVGETRDIMSVVQTIRDVGRTFCAVEGEIEGLSGEEYLSSPDVQPLWLSGATWELPPVTLTFCCESRPLAKATAAAIANCLSSSEDVAPLEE
jgi:hypothetical protein